MGRLTLTLLGGFQARIDPAQPLAIKQKKWQALLAVLAMRPGHEHQRAALVGLLWADSPEDHARHSLRQTLHGLRRLLAPVTPAPLVLQADSVMLDPAAVDVDVVAFERCARDGDSEALERATALYTGDLLRGLAVEQEAFEDWLRSERERLHELALEACAKLLAHQMRDARADPAVQTALRLLTLDPLQEVTHRALMRLYLRQGRRAAALRQYQVCVDVLQRELGVEPEAATREMYQQLLSAQGDVASRIEPVSTTARP
jgi:DNA-binding SARP family transcriptional activator